jgi:hypothetical protein
MSHRLSLSRIARSAAFAVLCVFCAAAGHSLMAGVDVALPATAWALVGTFAAAWLLTGRERGLATVTGAALAVQGALHLVFSWVQAALTVPGSGSSATADAWARALLCGPDAQRLLASHPGLAAQITAAAGLGAPTAPPVSGAGGAMAAMDSMPGVPGMVSMSEHGSMWGMASAHLLAALLCALWLAFGERGTFRMLRALAGLSRRAPALLAALRMLLGGSAFPVPGPPGRRALPHRGAALRRLLLSCTLTFRGPPVAVAAC